MSRGMIVCSACRKRLWLTGDEARDRRIVDDHWAVGCGDRSLLSTAAVLAILLVIIVAVFW